MNFAPLVSTYRGLEKYFTNSLWILGERVASLGLGLAAIVVAARFLGPDRFGSLSYAISIVGLFAVAGHMGLHGLIVRELVKHPESREEVLGTSAVLKFVGMGIGYLMLILYALVYEGLGSIEFCLIAIVGLSLLFRPSDVIDCLFQAFVQARYVAIARVLSHCASAGMYLALVLAGAGLVFFALAPVFQALVAALALLVFLYVKSDQRISCWRFSRARSRELLGQGWIIYLASLFAVIYLKVDQVMLRWLADTKEVGQYAIAAQLSEAWYFVPTAIVASFFPRLIGLRDQDKKLFELRLQQLFDALFTLGLVVAIIITLIGPWLIEVLFGSDFEGSAPILVIHIWAAIFIFMRAAFSKWILIENALHFSLITQGLGALANVLMNFLLIPRFGGLGAAVATLVSYSVASFLALLFYKRTRAIFWQMLWAAFAPIRYPMRLFRLG